MADGDRARQEGDDAPGIESYAMLDGLVEAFKGIQSPSEERRLIFAKGENYRHIRHEQVLARWPVLPEPWARRIEHARLSAVDRTPGPASFGR
jgi:hypothetical protein